MPILGGCGGSRCIGFRAHFKKAVVGQSSSSRSSRNGQMTTPFRHLRKCSRCRWMRRSPSPAQREGSRHGVCEAFRSRSSITQPLRHSISVSLFSLCSLSSLSLSLSFCCLCLCLRLRLCLCLSLAPYRHFAITTCFLASGLPSLQSSLGSLPWSLCLPLWSPRVPSPLPHSTPLAPRTDTNTKSRSKEATPWDF